MADRTNPAGEKWKKGRKKKRPLPGTPAQALNEAAGVKTAGTGNPGDRHRGESGKDPAAVFREKRSGTHPSAPSGKGRGWENLPPPERTSHGNLCRRSRRKHAPCGKKKCPWRMEQRHGHDELSMPGSLRGREKRQASKPPAMKKQSRGNAGNRPVRPFPAIAWRCACRNRYALNFWKGGFFAFANSA